MSMALAIETLDVEYVKARLEMAGYALQLLPSSRPAAFRVAWPEIPRTSLEAWVLQVQAESDPEVKGAIADDALRFKQTATREQIAALDEVLPWLYALDSRTRGVVMARSMSYGPGQRKISYRKIGHEYGGMTGERVRQIYEAGIAEIISKRRVGI